MKKLIKISKKISILILAISFFGCTNDDVELPKVIAGFTYTLNIDTGTVTFINISENSRSYVWTFGDGNSSTEINPIKTYANGTYVVTLKASNAAGASGIFEDEITILIPEIATLPITFDGENTNYNAVTFGGASFEIVDNPDPSGSNTSTSKVGAVTNIGAEYEGFYLDLGSPIDLSIDKTIKVNFWSNTPIDVLLKLEEGTGAPIEASANHNGTGWEEIYFTFDSAGSYSRFTLFVDGPGTTAGTFYLDDISQIATADIPCLETNLELPIDFDCNGIDYAIKIVGNVSFELVDNPELSGINSNPSKVGKITNVGENWENAFFNLDTPVDFSLDKGIKLKLFSDQALPIKLKFEDGTEAPVEADVNHTGTGWEELTFTFTSTASYNDMILFVDGPGTAAGTFYIDDIEQDAGDVGEPCVADTAQSFAASSFNISFETDPGTTETVGETDKLLLGDVGYEYLDNPDFDNAVNSSCKVAKIDKAGGFNYANVQIFTVDKFNFTDNAGFKLKIFSPNVGTNVLFKLEDTNNGGVFNQVSQLTTIANGWEELTFDFPASDTNKFDRIIIFFGFEQGDALTVHFDELNIYPRSGGGGTCVTDTAQSFAASSFNISFETDPGTTETVGETDKLLLGDVGYEYLDNPNFDNAVNSTCKVAKIDKAGGFNYANVQIFTADKFNFTDNAGFKLKIFSPNVGTNVLFKLEDTSNGGINNQVSQLTTIANGWEELTFDFPESDTNKFDRIIIFFGFEQGDALTVHFDELKIYPRSGGGGGSGDNLATNGDFETGDDTGWLLFQNGGTAVLDNTTNNGGSWSGKLETGGASNPAFKQERIGAGTVAAGDVVQIQFDHIGGIGGEGGVFNVLLFGEGAGGAVPFTHVFSPPPTPTGNWTTFTGTFTIPGGTDVSEGISFLIEAVCGGAPGCSVTVNIDNVSVILNP